MNELEMKLNGLKNHSDAEIGLAGIREENSGRFTSQDLNITFVGDVMLTCTNPIKRRLMFLKSGVAKGGLMNGFVTVKETPIKKPANRMPNKPTCSQVVLINYNEYSTTLTDKGHYDHMLGRWVLEKNNKEIADFLVNWWGYLPHALE